MLVKLAEFTCTLWSKNSLLYPLKYPCHRIEGKVIWRGTFAVCVPHLFECDEVVRVGLAVVEHHKQARVLHVVHQAVKSDVGLLWRDGWRNLHAAVPQRVGTSQDPSHKHALCAVCLGTGVRRVGWVDGIQGKVGPHAIYGGCKKRGNAGGWEWKTFHRGMTGDEKNHDVNDVMIQYMSMLMYVSWRARMYSM